MNPILLPDGRVRVPFAASLPGGGFADGWRILEPGDPEIERWQPWLRPQMEDPVDRASAMADVLGGLVGEDHAMDSLEQTRGEA